ncbi:hypothetical protein D3C86_1929500 [compost metagenome]
MLNFAADFMRIDKGALALAFRQVSFTHQFLDSFPYRNPADIVGRAKLNFSRDFISGIKGSIRNGGLDRLFQLDI